MSLSIDSQTNSINVFIPLQSGHFGPKIIAFPIAVIQYWLENKNRRLDSWQFGKSIFVCTFFKDLRKEQFWSDFIEVSFAFLCWKCVLLLASLECINVLFIRILRYTCITYCVQEGNKGIPLRIAISVCYLSE